MNDECSSSGDERSPHTDDIFPKTVAEIVSVRQDRRASALLTSTTQSRRPSVLLKTKTGGQSRRPSILQTGGAAQSQSPRQHHITTTKSSPGTSDGDETIRRDVVTMLQGLLGGPAGPSNDRGSDERGEDKGRGEGGRGVEAVGRGKADEEKGVEKKTETTTHEISSSSAAEWGAPGTSSAAAAPEIPSPRGTSEEVEKPASKVAAPVLEPPPFPLPHQSPRSPLVARGSARTARNVETARLAAVDDLLSALQPVCPSAAHLEPTEEDLLRAAPRQEGLQHLLPISAESVLRVRRHVEEQHLVVAAKTHLLEQRSEQFEKSLRSLQQAMSQLLEALRVGAKMSQLQQQKMHHDTQQMVSQQCGLEQRLVYEAVVASQVRFRGGLHPPGALERTGHVGVRGRG